MQVLILYDIAHPKRLNKVAKVILDYGERVQYSIFEAEVGKRQFKKMKERILKIIDEEKDGVKFFILCERCKFDVEFLGRKESRKVEVDFVVV